jgi:prepilin-type N-terminal cleavage/methylation domain-containing protein
MNSLPKRRARTVRPAFTLVELVIVVTILGMVAAIAVPRMSTAGASASANALELTLTNIRKSIDVYFAEHGRFPGYVPATGAPSGPDFVRQLTMYSDRAGNTSATYGGGHIYGPYLRSPFARNPINQLDTVHVKPTRAAANPAPGSVGWVAVLGNGDFGILATDADLDKVGVIEAPQKIEVRVTE